jgi:hypothetical protein
VRISSFAIPALFAAFCSPFVIQACSATPETNEFTTSSGTTGPVTSGVGGNMVTSTGVGIDLDASLDGSGCSSKCSSDQHQVLGCDGTVIATCTGLEGCDQSTGTCVNACDAAVNNKQSVGCEYYATFMDQSTANACFAVFVANTWNTPAHITVEYDGVSLPVSSFGRIPSGSGPGLTYQPFDAAAGIPPGEVVVLFLSGPQGSPSPGNAPCPITSAIPSGVLLAGTTGIGNSFRVGSDVPVVSYEINPYGGGSAAVTAGSLLLPTSAWDTNYIAVNAYEYDIDHPSMNIVAMADGTQVTMVPVAAVQGGGGIPASPANAQMTFTLNRGEHAQLTQQQALTGSVIESDKPIGFMAGQRCMRAPFGVAYCDHGEQMIPPVRALGSEYVGVMHKPRMNEPGIWRVIGAVDGTQLTYSDAVGGPAALDRGQVVEFITGQPFVVKSQDPDHPFMLFNLMSGSTWQPGMEGYGDADFVISVPPQQYMPAYVFFADPTYPETSLVIIRSKVEGQFKDVTLDCAGVLQGWQPIGEYEWTRTDLITGNFQNVGACSTGRHDITSEGPFGLWVWGWGTPLTDIFTANVSYGYPGGMNVQQINEVIIPPDPR